jgi:hypothetical protein
VRSSADCCHSTSAKVHVYHVVGCGGTNIADHGSEENQANDDIGDVVVLFNVRDKGPICCLKRAEPV